ncbi:MAG: DUF3426 domain-containing protein [Wenzhouxiangellaceae bacterium]|nr:DUF3426 domain-containing protein [Wenzhouxiangellaceae bacterium]
MSSDGTTARTPVWRRLLLAALVSGAVAASPGCVFWRGSDSPSDESGWSRVKPDDDGLYAVAGDDLIRLDGDAEWEKKTWGKRSNLPPDIEFVIRDSSLEEYPASGAEIMGVQKVAWVRSVVTADGKVVPVSGSQWQNAPLPVLAVPLEFAERTESDIVRARATQPIEPGLYAIHLEKGDSAREARFGVGWPELDRQAYAASVCVDRYAGVKDAYSLCSGQAPASPGNPLRIYLVKPDIRAIGPERSMVISGVVINNSEQTHTVPVLNAELRDASGRPLAQWRFQASSTELEPGRHTTFRTEVKRAPQQVHSVNVDFASTQASGS